MYQMVDAIKGKNKVATRQRAFWIFLKAQLSAQIASIVDFLTTILLAKLLGLFYLHATFIGSVTGGVVNCSVNYKWVFGSQECKKLHVALKYIVVWGGSILLNTWGTFLLTEWLTAQPRIINWLGHYVDNVFIAAKMVVALLVGFFWNYYLQREFVYRNRDIKHFWRHYLDKKDKHL